MNVTVYGASWCVPCSTQEDILSDSDIEYEYVDVDDNLETVRELGIHLAPTIIVWDEGEEVERFVGVTQIDELDGVVSE